jgi:hypothetical protein
MEDHMDWKKLTDDERLMAEQAVAAYQAVKQAAALAPQGQGMARMEQAVQEKGFDVLRQMLQLAACDHSEAQKKTGHAADPAGAGRQ